MEQRHISHPHSLPLEEPLNTSHSSTLYHCRNHSTHHIAPPPATDTSSTYHTAPMQEPLITQLNPLLLQEPLNISHSSNHCRNHSTHHTVLQEPLNISHSSTPYHQEPLNTSHSFYHCPLNTSQLPPTVQEPLNSTQLHPLPL